MNTLYLTLNKEPFYQILSGEKKEEYRRNILYWVKRILKKEFDEIFFRNGYTLGRPWMRVESRYVHVNDVDDIITLGLGKIIEKGNIP